MLLEATQLWYLVTAALENEQTTQRWLGKRHPELASVQRLANGDPKRTPRQGHQVKSR